jgi:hypothetical protein
VQRTAKPFVHRNGALLLGFDIGLGNDVAVRVILLAQVSGEIFAAAQRRKQALNR